MGVVLAEGAIPFTESFALAILAWLILFTSAAVFVGDLIANMISFKNRFMNAVLLAVIAGLAVFAYGMFHGDRPIADFVVGALIAAALAFVAGYIGNRIAFGNRFLNALVTAIVFAVLSGIGLFAWMMIA